jgi:hypothetical protein
MTPPGLFVSGSGEVGGMAYFRKSGGRMGVNLNRPEKKEKGLEAVKAISHLFYCCF